MLTWKCGKVVPPSVVLRCRPVIVGRCMVIVGRCHVIVGRCHVMGLVRGAPIRRRRPPGVGGATR